MADITIRLPEEVQSIIKTIEEHGEQAFAVGGCIRDCMMGRKPKDWDITTSAVPGKVKAMFKRTVDTGIKHGTVTVMIGKTGYEVTTYRIDGEYLDGRHPESVAFSASLSDDLKRRDFTINAMAYNDSTGLVDEFDGLGDLNRRLIRCVGNAKERFTEDALRMMRAVRFSAQLGFEIEPETYGAITRLAPSIRQVSMERIQMELTQTLMSKHPAHVQLFQKTGLFNDILPDIYSILCGDQAEHTLAMLRHAISEPVYRYAALLGCMQPKAAATVLKTLRLDNHTIDMVTKLISLAQVNIEENERAVREVMCQYGRSFFPMLLSYERAAAAAQEEISGTALPDTQRHLDMLGQMYEQIIARGDCTSVRELAVTGNDLMELGMSGRQVGTALKKLLCLVLEDPRLNDKETLIARLK